MKKLFLCILSSFSCLLFISFLSGCSKKQENKEEIVSSENIQIENITKEPETEQEKINETKVLTGYTISENEYGHRIFIRDDFTKEHEVNLFNEVDISIFTGIFDECEKVQLYSDDLIKIDYYHTNKIEEYYGQAHMNPFIVINGRMFLCKYEDDGRLFTIKKIYETKKGIKYLALDFITKSGDVGNGTRTAILMESEAGEITYLLDYLKEKDSNESSDVSNFGFIEKDDIVFLWLCTGHYDLFENKINTNIFDVTKSCQVLKNNSVEWVEHDGLAFKGGLPYIPAGRELKGTDYNKNIATEYKCTEDTAIVFKTLGESTHYEGSDENGVWYQMVKIKNDDINLNGDFPLYDIKLVEEILISNNLKRNDSYRVTENLRLRESEDTSSNIITTMKENEIVTILKIGKEDTIDEITSNWVKVRAKYSNVEGWCFGGYLE